MCCPLLGFTVGGHWKDQEVQQLHQYGKVLRFIYKHDRIHNLMRDKIGGDRVRPGVTRFATSSHIGKHACVGMV
jgi:hypothetical protein